MAAAGRSLTPFYVGLGAILVIGGALIARAAMEKGSSSAAAQPASVLPTLAALSGPRGVAMGSDSAPVEIAEYSDFQCPYCARFAVLQMPDLRDRLVASGRVRWRFMHFPLDGHPNSPAAHLAAACANEQGKFWQMHDALYQGQGDWSESRNPERMFGDYAERIGLDRSRYGQCVRERRAWPQVLADKARGDSLGVSATPTFFVNGRELPALPTVTYDLLKAKVDSIAPLAPPAPPAGPAPAAQRPAGGARR